MPELPVVGPEGEDNYGEWWADVYDTIHEDVDADMLDLLVELSGEPPRALELAVGTGRVAIPLAERWVEVFGVDISKSMVKVLADKPGGAQIHVTVDDMADFELGSQFPLVYVVFNSFFAMSIQERQVKCFETVSGHLEPEGRFLLECFVPDLRRFDHENTRMSVTEIGSDGEHAYELAIHDPVNQKINAHHVRRSSDGDSRVLPVELRYVWPAEMDLMAQLAGLRLETRWNGYDRMPFNERSDTHISIYKKA